jgi:HSP20 family molecular chaperone IbpA
MALPVRVERGRAADPFTLSRNDFDTMISRLLGEGPEGGPLASLANFGVDIREDEDHIYVEADLPGFRKEDVDISLENGTLSIIAEHREERTEPEDRQQEGQRAQGQGGQPQGQEAQGQQRQSKQQQQQARSPQPNGQYLLRERRIQRVVRSFTLPPNVDEQNVQATLENGVLRITLNKRDDAKPHRVQIT